MSLTRAAQLTIVLSAVIVCNIIFSKISGHLPSSPYTISLVVDLDTFKTHLQNFRCTLSTAAAVWNPHNSHEKSNTGNTSLSNNIHNSFGLGSINLYAIP